ncbi:hypothetical protein ACQPZ8_30095 [Actinomadura nitritigenes]|uniref:hypothetical protein n=1 Tax=Actinomadura nitritigenes TaxID=134602 RepID=UPI003D918C1E
MVDDHMFCIGGGVWYPDTFRLQLFTAPGARPVAVAIQATNEGASLVNGRERYLAEVWRRHCPDEPQPPLWIRRQLLRGWDEFVLHEMRADPQPAAEPYAVSPQAASTHRVTLEEIRRLVGADVAPDRGAGYVPRPPEPHVAERFTVVWVGLFPRPAPFREDDCMPAGTPPVRRAARQLAHRRRGRICCWYHEGNWRTVSRTAIGLLRRADRDSVAQDEMDDYFEEQIPRLTLTGWERQALRSLTADPIRFHRDGLRRAYTNGQHRAQAMLDYGVKRTIATRLVVPDLVRDPDWPHNSPTAAELGLPDPLEAQA